ncbi:MAG: lanthionine synthetase C family protein [Bacteroidales bacterium]|nr:lanthionine synthetase C family protein [Bacteroidales bacterium]
MKVLLRKKIDEIASILLKHNSKESISLLGGGSGVSLFFFIYSKLYANEESNDFANSLLAEVFENDTVYPTFAGGLSGIGWLIEFLEQNNLIECDTDETIGELDEYLNKTMLSFLNEGNYDYLHGAGGIALYFLKRNRLNKFEGYISNFVDILKNKGVFDIENEVKWISKIGIHEPNPTDVYNISLSHGLSSTISILTKICSQNINAKTSFELLKKSLNFLLRYQQDAEKIGSFFPSTVSIENHTASQSRLGWCYGDLGIAVSLYNAAKLLNDAEIEKFAIEVLLFNSKRRDLEENSVRDAGMCHGTAGIAHIYKRMFLNTRLKEFKETANFWYEQTLNMAYHKDSLSGYKAFRTEKYGGWTEEFGFLEGIAGIGLALMSSISDIDPAWDEILLLS